MAPPGLHQCRRVCPAPRLSRRPCLRDTQAERRRRGESEEAARSSAQRADQGRRTRADESGPRSKSYRLPSQPLYCPRTVAAEPDNVEGSRRK